jgi:ATP-dependent RNA helicase RhlE
VYFVPKKRKQALLEHVLHDKSVTRVLVFTRTKHGANRVVKRLTRAGWR